MVYANIAMAECGQSNKRLSAQLSRDKLPKESLPVCREEPIGRGEIGDSLRPQAGNLSSIRYAGAG
jgi:hypothetical protein